MRIERLNTYWVLLLATCSLWSLQASAQSLNPPVLLCATNNLSGDVTLDWSIPVNPCGVFEGYEVWASMTPDGPYSLLTTVLAEATT